MKIIKRKLAYRSSQLLPRVAKKHRSASGDDPKIPDGIGVGLITRGIVRFPCDSMDFSFVVFMLRSSVQVTS